MQYIVQLIIVVFSAIVHEVMHGAVAEQLGDDTARQEGRLTLNPLPHIDPLGTILIPLVLFMVHSPVILGAAKPVPVRFDRLRHPRLGMVLVSLAGPGANLALAAISALIIRFGLASQLAVELLVQVVIINIVLAVFNLIPIPPLDGSKVLAALAPTPWTWRILSFERYGLLLVFIFLYLGLLDKILLPVVALFLRLFGLG